MLETVCTARKRVRIAGDDYPAELVKSKFLKLDGEHIRFVLECMLYSNAEDMTTLMLNEFVEKIIVHERDRKGSADTTQKIEIYFNLIGEYIPPTMAEKDAD